MVHKRAPAKATVLGVILDLVKPSVRATEYMTRGGVIAETATKATSGKLPYVMKVRVSG